MSALEHTETPRTITERPVFVAKVTKKDTGTPLKSETKGWQGSLINVEISCTKGQVCQGEDREIQAKVRAKVEFAVTCVFTVGYIDIGPLKPVLGDSFRPKNVTTVPSLFGQHPY